MAATICPRPVTLTFDLLTLKSVWESESHVTWGTPVQSFVFLGLLFFELEPMYATSDRRRDGRTDDGRRSPLNAPPTGRGHNKPRTLAYTISRVLTFTVELLIVHVNKQTVCVETVDTINRVIVESK